MKQPVKSELKVSAFSADDLKKITDFFSILICIDQKNKHKPYKEADSHEA